MLRPYNGQVTLLSQQPDDDDEEEVTTVISSGRNMWERGQGHRSVNLRDLTDKNVVTIGGGTGPFGVLSNLKHYPCRITAIVTMADSGGSSRRLMDEFGQLPFGDLRQALVALSRKGRLWRDVFTYRFEKTNGNGGGKKPEEADSAGEHGTSIAQSLGRQAGVSGHSLGNLIISALQEINDGNLLQALEDAQDLLDTAGKVLPVTLSHATLCAELEDGQVICSETEIDTRGKQNNGVLSPVKRVFLDRETPSCEEALRAIKRADIIVMGPGDLYTSVLPNLLVKDVADAIRISGAQTIYVCNLMTKRGETEGFKVSDFVRQIQQYLGGRVDRVIAHDGSFPPHLLGRYAEEAQHPVELDEEAVRELVPDVIIDNFVAFPQEHLVRHDPDRLVAALFSPPNFG
jgi:uncharacterized cofD-like protein